MVSRRTIVLPVLALVLVILMVSFWRYQQTHHQGIRLEGMVGTASWHVSLQTLPDNITEEALQVGIEKVIATANQRIGSWDPNSEISRFNQSQTTDWFSVSPELAKLVATTLSLSQQSHGVYDVTIGPLIKLWGFNSLSNAQDKVHTQADIDTARAKVGYQKLQVRQDPPALRKTQPDIVVELASVADGFAVDQAGQYLESLGIQDYMAEVAGEIRTRGLSPRGDAWRIAIEKPIDLGRAVQQGINLQNAGLATSGDYRNFFTEKGRRYSHTIDPANGYPVQHNLASVSVLADNTTLADGYATLLMALGETAGRNFADKYGLSAYFIWRTDTGFETYATEKFKNVLMK